MVNVPEQYVWAQLTGPTRPNLTITGSLFIDGDPIVTNQGGLLLEISGAGDLGSEILISQNQPGDKTVVKNPTAKNWGPGYVLLRFGGSTKRAVAGQGPGTYGRVEYDLQISGMAPCAPPPEGSTVTCNPTVPQAAQCDKEAGRPISTRSGAFFESYTDLSVGGLGQPLEVKRTYNSLLRTTDSEFGFGWSSSLAPRLRVDWPTTGDATFRWSSGSEVKYSYTNTSGSVRRYTAPPWVTGKLTATGSNSSRVFTLVLPNGFVWKFNSTGQPLESADRNGYKLVYSYVSSKLSTVTQLPTNRMLSVTWTTTTPPRVDTVTDPAGRVVDYDYDSSGNLIQAATKEPNGGPLVTTGTWKWGYGTGSEPAQHRVLTVRDPRQVAAGAGGLDMVNEYTGERVTTQTMPNNVRYLFGYAGATDALTTTVTLQEKVGSTWTDRQKRQDIHVAGRRVRTIEGVGSAQQMTYDFSYDPTTGGVTRTSLILSGSSVTMAQSEYDAKGRVTKVTDRAGRFTTMSYNSFGQVTQSVDNKGVPSRFAYSAEGDLHEVESDNVATGRRERCATT